MIRISKVIFNLAEFLCKQKSEQSKVRFECYSRKITLISKKLQKVVSDSETKRGRLQVSR